VTNFESFTLDFSAMTFSLGDPQAPQGNPEAEDLEFEGTGVLLVLHDGQLGRYWACKDSELLQHKLVAGRKTQRALE
jgi:hypothetical protein